MFFWRSLGLTVFTIADSHRSAVFGRQSHIPDRWRGTHKVVEILRVSPRLARINRYLTRGAQSPRHAPPNLLVH